MASVVVLLIVNRTLRSARYTDSRKPARAIAGPYAARDVMYWFPMRRFRRLIVVVALSAAISACKDGDTVVVHSLTFTGVRGADVMRLKAVLATRENTRVPVVGWQLPWSKTNPFDRGRFDADLKRIEAFYTDRGYPDARVTAFDVKLNRKKDAVDVT